MNTSGVASPLRGEAVPSGAARWNATRGNGVGPPNDAVVARSFDTSTAPCITTCIPSAVAMPCPANRGAYHDDTNTSSSPSSPTRNTNRCGSSAPNAATASSVSPTTTGL